MQLAVIREAECVGCTKCILACPVDAIIGASQFLHTVIADECIGCGLCVAPCPMDCIDMIENPLDKLKEDNEAEKTKRGTQAKARYQARQKRLILQEQPKLPTPTNPTEKQRIKEEIKAAVIRVKEKRTINPILQKNKQ